MTGGGFVPGGGGGEEYDLGGPSHAVQWVGTPSVKGPRWAKMPLLTVGMLGIQCVWSIEMGYASPYLLELGLSKSYMSLVFMAGPLSGLIVQPLIGIFADRSKSHYGRRRPYMWLGISICGFAMMLLGWAKEIGGGGYWSVGFAVFAIYLIDFSINAAMSSDRALVVDTLPPEKQEEGSAWAGRMFGFGSVAGFFVGNLDLVPVFPFLGGSQIQILSFLTSFLLLVTHGFTSWAVTERVLLRDDRPQAQSGLWRNLRAIWDNMFTLPKGIRTVCYIQFFAFLGWFPILFFTSIWVSEIYKSSYTGPELEEAELNAQGVRAGARALLFQALVNITCSIGLPYLVTESGVQANTSGSGRYQSLQPGSREEDEGWKPMNMVNNIRSGSLPRKMLGAVMGLMRGMKDWNVLSIPIKGLTLVRLWWISQFTFAGAMALTWFTTTVHGAYVIIGITGFSWGLAQWAPYSLLGELILIDGTINTDDLPPPDRSSLEHDYVDDSNSLSSPTPKTRSSKPPYQNTLASSSSLGLGVDDSFQSQDIQHGGEDMTPYVSQKPSMPSSSTVILHHSDDSDEELENEIQDLSFSLDAVSSSPTGVAPIRRRPSPSPALKQRNTNTADKAGVILGIHNVFVVLPQFVVTLMASIIFHIMEPGTGGEALPVKHPNAIPIGNGTISEIDEIVRLVVREGGMEGGSSDAVGLIFRIGGVAAAIGGFICLRLGQDWARGRGL